MQEKKILRPARQSCPRRVLLGDSRGRVATWTPKACFKIKLPQRQCAYIRLWSRYLQPGLEVTCSPPHWPCRGYPIIGMGLNDPRYPNVRVLGPKRQTGPKNYAYNGYGTLHHHIWVLGPSGYVRNRNHCLGRYTSISDADPQGKGKHRRGL